MTELALALESVVKAYRGTSVLRGVDLRLANGETVGFVGPNGAGKTTCLRLLVGLTHRDAGTAIVLGMDPSHRPLAIRRRCTYLPGETNLYDNLTGAEFLDFALSFYPRHDDALAARMTASFELPLQRRVRQYSAGMKQKLALMAVLIPDVEVYLLDEPDRNLDPPARLFLREVLLGLQGRDKSILFSSHHLGEVDAIAHRLTFLLDGGVVDDARVDRARASLRRVVRIRLTNGTELPDRTESVSTDPDGCLRVIPLDDPLVWLARLDPAKVRTVEVGATRLDDLYRLLDAGEATP